MSISVSIDDIQITVEEELSIALADATTHDHAMNDLPLDFDAVVRTDMERECQEKWLLVAELRDLAAAQRRIDLFGSLMSL